MISSLWNPAPHIAVPNDDCTTRELLNTEFLFEYVLIRCTPEMRTEWERAASAGDKLRQLTKKAMDICAYALSDLTSGHPCSLHFYVSDTNDEGYSDVNGVHINLVHVLGTALSDQNPTMREMSAYYAVLISHEFAHYLKLSDGHSMHHARRTEVNLQKLWNNWPADLDG